jgi:hypothetical protein
MRRKEIVLYRERSRLEPLSVLPELNNRACSSDLPVFALCSLPYLFIFSCISRARRREREIQRAEDRQLQSHIGREYICIYLHSNS